MISTWPTSTPGPGDVTSLLLRTTGARLLVPIGVLIAAGVLLTDRGWQGGWGDSTLRATTDLVFLLPFVMLAGVLDAGRLLRPGGQPTAASAVRQPTTVVLSVTAAPAVWGAGGYLLVLVTGWAVTARVNPLWPAPIPVVWILAGVTAVVAHAALGVLVGRCAPAPAGLASSVGVGLLGNAVLSGYQGRVPALFTVADAAFLGGAAAPRPVVQVGQAVFFLAVAAVGVIVTAALVRRGRREVVLAGVAVVVAIGAGIALAATGGPKRTYLADAEGPRTCSDDGIVCLWSDQAFLVAAYAEVGGRMLAGAPAGLPVDGWTAEGLRPPPGHAAVYVSGNAPTADAVAVGARRRDGAPGGARGERPGAGRAGRLADRARARRGRPGGSRPVRRHRTVGVAGAGPNGRRAVGLVPAGGAPAVRNAL